MDAPQLARASVQTHAAKARPDARPMRLALGAGGIAALSALATAIVLPPRPTTLAPVTRQQQAPAVDPVATSTPAPPTSIQVQRPIRYVQLSPGQTAPPGATVIEASAPTPITVVVTVNAPAQPAAAAPAKQPAAVPAPVVVTTAQSGKVGP